MLMTPKSLLRHKRVVSRPRRDGAGHDVPSPAVGRRQARPGEKIKLKPDDKIRRVVLCSGKVYYDLYEAREAAGVDDVYLLRLEQLYPFPAKALMHELSRFPQRRDRLGQEEPRNMGAWTFIEPNVEWVLAAHADRQHAPALRRPAAVGGDGHRARQQARPRAEDAGRAGAG